MENTLLYSPTELTMLRANKQAQRQLDVTCRQIEQEKDYMARDWDNRMKSFLVQKKKVLPPGWDNTRFRSTTAWSARPKTSNNGILHGDYGAPTIHSHKIPRSWQLRASYQKTADGRMISRPLHARRLELSGESPVTTPAAEPRRRAQQRAVSAPMLHSRQREPTTRVIQQRPVSAIPNNSFLVTQIEMENMILRMDSNNDDVFLNSLNDTSCNQSENLTHYKQRPLSAVNTHTDVQQFDLSAATSSNRPSSSGGTLGASSPPASLAPHFR